ncbi:hypothetical protein L227DRAFT_580210 [Lentinus tigrinus ALCF2SS1-6]|uniref:Transmembrane protein n=1 Tax=Lentinus tigrinus ALCF2SS1-6 TaxID=1328759 RepID=A0A5C2RVS2_9APHY|nr:hypothetical protein L227DRAFT_580210 [Lentinus tigrinus ALCF2SS1-6]
MSATSVDTAATLAPMLLGTSLSLIPYGISLHQMFIYARVGQRSDGPCIRYLALVATFFDTLEIAFAMHFCYHYLVTNYSNPSALNHTVWSLNISVISGTFVMLFTQIFFLRRVSMIELKHRLVVYAATVFVLIKFGLAMSLAGRAFTDDQGNVYVRSETITALMYACGTMASVMLTSMLLNVLFKLSASQREYVQIETRSRRRHGLDDGVLHQFRDADMYLRPRVFDSDGCVSAYPLVDVPGSVHSQILSEYTVQCAQLTEAVGY